MTAAARKLMTADEFLVWALDQEETYELVDGVPIPKFRDAPEMMAGGTRAHAEVSTNILVALASRLRGSDCRAYNDDLAVRVSATRLRRPDVTVECGSGNPRDLEAAEPRVLFEVLSPSSERDDFFFKPEEYKRIDSVRQFVVVDPNAPVLKVWTRDQEGRWSDDSAVGLEATLDLPSLGIGLPLAEIYEGVQLEPDVFGVLRPFRGPS